MPVRESLAKRAEHAAFPRPVLLVCPRAVPREHSFVLLASTHERVYSCYIGIVHMLTAATDTNLNIKNLKEFAVSIISEPFLEAANYTAVDAPTGVDEWALSGLTKRESE